MRTEITGYSSTSPKGGLHIPQTHLCNMEVLYAELSLVVKIQPIG